jgi:SAM-dependent methyltransferase
MAMIENRHWWFVARRALFAEVLRPNIPEPGSILVDVGCGTGGNLRFLGAYGAVVGLELNAAAAQIAAAHGQVVRGGDTEFWPIAENSVTTFTALDVLEHIPDDKTAMIRLFASLKPGGILLLSVPAYRWLWSEHDELLHHQRRYNRRDVTELAASAGFSIDYVSYHNCILFPVSVFLRVLSRLSGGRIGIDENRVPPPPINGLLRKVYSLERHLVRNRVRLPFGLSIMAVLRKPASAISNKK